MIDTKLILTINPGSTSTKIAVFADEARLLERKVDHSAADLAPFDTVGDQFQMRKAAIVAALTAEGFDLGTLAAVAGRGGKLPPLKRGAYLVNDDMVEFLRHRPIDQHASNLGALIAHDIAEPLGIPSFIYDAVVVDEMEDIARFSGVPELTRRASCHVLNMRAMAIKVLKRDGLRLEDANIVVCHMGGGVTATVISGGRMIDVLTDEEGPFSPERAGRVPCRQLVDLCFSGDHDRKSATKLMRGVGGLVAYLGTNSALEVEARIDAGDAEADLVYRAMAYQIAKGIGELSTVVMGKVDRIVLTGAIAHSQRMTDMVSERVAFIAPVEIVPGENELEALAAGTLRVLRGEETPNVFVAPPRPRPAAERRVAEVSRA
ncbi:butyrate kinase [Rhodoplanes sp. SY1]|uniref:butyrate kinase n=1 Tax=Rhodoplanes sp. SY1 TaxID=3166646 RepID=UPI0038B48969